MSTSLETVSCAEALMSAVKKNHAQILVKGVITDLPAITLAQGVSLTGENATLKFKSGQPGISLSSNCRLSQLRIETDPRIYAVSIADEFSELGEITLEQITTVGRVHLEAAQALKAKLTLDKIHVEQADASMAAHRPSGYGVEVLLGAISVYNFSKNPRSLWRLQAQGLSCGSAQSPVKGSGVFVFGGDYIAADADLASAPAPTVKGGQIEVKLLASGEIHANGCIAAGTPNLITAGVFLGSGAHGVRVENHGPVFTYGVNDMVLDNWGVCELWIAHEKITSRNTSGIGFVNFGQMNDLQILAPIETFGLGARGFNLYDGSLKSATFKSITTHGDGAIAIQLAKPFGSIRVLGDVCTTGGGGESLVRGKIVYLNAHGLSLKPGTQGQSLIIDGKVTARNPEIAAYEFVCEPSCISQLLVNGQSLHH